MNDLRTAAQQALEALIENARLLGGTQAKKGFGCYSQKDANLERAWHEGIAKHSATIRAALEQKAEPVAEDAKQQALDALNRMQSILMMSGGRHPRDVLRTYIQLTAAPPQRKPLTDAEIEKLFGGAVADAPRAHWLRQAAIEVVRKTEAAHGIGEEE